MCQRLTFLRAAMAGCAASMSVPAVPSSRVRLCILVSSVCRPLVQRRSLSRLPDDMCRCRRGGEADEKEVCAVVPPASAARLLALCQPAKSFDIDPFRRLRRADLQGILASPGNQGRIAL